MRAYLYAERHKGNQKERENERLRKVVEKLIRQEKEREAKKGAKGWENPEIVARITNLPPIFASFLRARI